MFDLSWCLGLGLNPNEIARLREEARAVAAAEAAAAMEAENNGRPLMSRYGKLLR